MPIDLKTRLDLAKSDPNLVTWVFHGGVEPEDLYLHQKLGGDFLRYEEMLQDTQIAGKLFERVGAVLGRSILIDAGGKDKKSRDAASIARRILDIPDPAELERRKKAGEDVYVNRLIPYEQICSNFLLSGLLCGFSVQAVTGNRQVDNLLLPNLEVVPQRRFIFSYHEPEKDVPVCTDEKLDPKKDIALVNGYELRLLTKRSPIDGERCPKNRFFTFTYGSLRGIPWGLGLGYRLRKFYEIRSECLKSAVLGGDRLGSPPVHGIYPDTINPTDLEHKAILDAFNRLLQAISPNAHASTSPGFEVKFLEPKSGGHDLIEWLYNTATAEISNGVWGDRSYAEKETGSFAAQNAQNESRNENITDNDCNSLDEQLASQLWQWIGEHNFPDASFPVIRRETASERRKLQMESEQEDLRAKKLATDRQLILDVGCEVKPEYITATYGEAFTLPPPPEEEEQPSEELEPEAEETEEFAANVDRFLDWQGLRLGLRYPPGATRFPQYRSSKKLQNGYGFIQGVKQNGKALRCYLHPDLLTGSQDGKMFAIAQLDPKTGEEDELKYMLGYPSLESAELAYRREMPEVFFGGIREISADELADFSETKVYGIWFQGRNTPYVTRAGDRNDAIRKARASKCAGWDRDVVSCRPLSGKYLEQAKKGQWVRLRANGTEEGGSFKFRPQLKPDYAEEEEEDIADIYEQRLAEQLTEGYGSAIAIVQQFVEQINDGEGTSEEKYRRFSEGIYDLFEQMPVEALSQVLGEGLAAGYFAGMYEERADK